MSLVTLIPPFLNNLPHTQLPQTLPPHPSVSLRSPSGPGSRWHFFPMWVNIKNRLSDCPAIGHRNYSQSPGKKHNKKRIQHPMTLLLLTCLKGLCLHPGEFLIRWRTILNWTFYLKPITSKSEACYLLDYFLHCILRLIEDTEPSILHLSQNWNKVL